MLSRIAEAMYWTGRYTERAEDTARLLDVAQRAALEGSDLGSSETLAAVLGGVPITGSRNSLLNHYCLDRAATESIASCVKSARENARTIRDAVASEMWESLNGWHLQMTASHASDLDGSGAHAFLTGVKTRAYHFAGATEASLPRSEAWSWLQVGRSLERLSFTCRVVGRRAGALEMDADDATAAETWSWSVLLRSLSAYEAYRSTYRAQVSPERVVEFLLLDTKFPRSALFNAVSIDRCAEVVLDDASGAHARRLAGRLRSEISHREVEDVLDEGLVPFVSRIGGLAASIHMALVDGPFARGLVGMGTEAPVELDDLSVGPPGGSFEESAA